MDGYAVAAGSLSGDYVVAGEILPGDPARPAPAAGQAWRIFTGAVVPANSAIVMIEDTVVFGEHVTLKSTPQVKHIRRRGSSIQASARLLTKGQSIGAGEVAVLASVGTKDVAVIPRPRVLHVTTGREIIPFYEVPEAGQIRDTNGPLISALLNEAGAELSDRFHVDESIGALTETVNGAREFDLLLVSGGSSAGAYDRTSQALELLGFSVLSQKVNARPGKPLIVARRGQQWAFGLPGNPVSHFVAFHVFVARALRRLVGRPLSAAVHARLGDGAALSSEHRETFWPAKLVIQAGRLVAHPLPWLDSGDLIALVSVNGLIHLPANSCPSFNAEVDVILCGQLR